MFSSWLVSLVTLAISILFFVASFSLKTMSGSDPVGPALFPHVVIVVTVATSVVLLVQLVRTADLNAAARAFRDFVTIRKGDGATRGLSETQRVAISMVLSAIYPLVMLKIGFILGTVLFMFVVAVMLRLKIVSSIVMSIVVSVSIYFLFSEILSARITPGEWFDVAALFPR